MTEISTTKGDKPVLILNSKVGPVLDLDANDVGDRRSELKVGVISSWFIWVGFVACMLLIPYSMNSKELTWTNAFKSATVNEKSVVVDAFNNIDLFLKPSPNFQGRESKNWNDVYKYFPNKSWENIRGKNYWDTNFGRELNLIGPFYVAFLVNGNGRPNSYIYSVDFYSETNFEPWVIELFLDKFKPIAAFCNKNSDTKLYILLRSVNNFSIVEYNKTTKQNPVLGGVSPIVNNLYFYYDGFSNFDAKRKQLMGYGFYECK